MDTDSTSEDSLSDEDELLIQHLDSPFYSRKVNERSDLLNTLRDDEFIKRFRLSKETAIYLLQKICHELGTSSNR